MEGVRHHKRLMVLVCLATQLVLHDKAPKCSCSTSHRILEHLEVLLQELTIASLVVKELVRVTDNQQKCHHTTRSSAESTLRCSRVKERLEMEQTLCHLKMPQEWLLTRSITQEATI